MSIRGTVRLGVAELERRDNPSSFWEDTYVGAFLSGLGEGAENIATGAADGVTEVINTGSDLYTIYTSGDDLDPSDLESSLFQGAAATAGDQDAADAFDNHLVYGIATLGVGPLVESGYDAAVTGDSTQFSQQSGAFGVMVLVPYAGVRGLNALPPVRVPYPALRPGMALMTADGAIIPTGGTVAVEWATVGTVAVPAEASTAIAGAGGVVVMAMSADGNGGGGVDGFSSFEEAVEQAAEAGVGQPRRLDRRRDDPRGPQ